MTSHAVCVSVQVADGRLVFAAMLTIAHQFNRVPLESAEMKHRMILSSVATPSSFETEENRAANCCIQVEYSTM
jgi:hypothetical protein